MNYLKILAFVFIITIHISSKAQFVKAELQVGGLTCSMCSKSVDKTLRTISFIESIDVDLEHTTYLLRFKKDASVNPDLIAKKVKDAGFSVSKLTMWFNFNNIQVPKDGHWNWQNSSFMFMNVENKNMNGIQALTFVDYAFVTKKEFLKNLSKTTYNCYKTGQAETCCPASIPSKARIYHVVL